MPKRRVSHRDAVAAGSYRLTPDPGSGFLSPVGLDPPGAEDSLNSTKDDASFTDDASSSSPDDARKVRTGRRRRRRRRTLAGWGAFIDARDETRVAARGAMVTDIGTTIMARARVTRGGGSSSDRVSRRRAMSDQSRIVATGQTFEHITSLLLPFVYSTGGTVSRPIFPKMSEHSP